MKQIYILTAFFLITAIKLNAQTTDVVTGLNGPNGLVLNGNDLYISERNAGKISKIDITDSTPTATDVVTGLNEPTGLVLNGNDLYIAEFNGDKISKIDITDSTPTATDVVTGLNGPTGLVLNGNDLYIAELIGDKISRIDITDTTPTASTIVMDDGVRGLMLNGNDLYIANVILDKISRINITDSTPTIVDLVTGINNPNTMILIENEIYFSVFSDDLISKIDLGELSKDTYLLNRTIKFYPNPASNYIIISGLDKEINFEIYNTLGVKIQKGNISNDEKIDVQNLTNGIYFLTFENGNTLKFIKE